MNYICIKKLEKEGISFICDADTKDMFYVEKIYPEGMEIPNEDVLEITGKIEKLWHENNG